VTKVVHAHGDFGVHVHDELDADAPDSEHALWKSDHIELTSVGIDIGSATYQSLVSTVKLRRDSQKLSSRYRVVSRDVVFLSPVRLTPYTVDYKIDEELVQSSIHGDWKSVGISVDDIDSGSVLLTGEALRRENAEALANALAASVGAFVCVSAGHHMEATLAAQGSGAVELSKHDSSRVLNIDIGGGTTKYTLVDAGRIVRTAALHVGGRLAAFDDGKLIRLEPAGSQIAAAYGVNWELGGSVRPDDVVALGDRMAALIAAGAGWATPAQLPGELTLADLWVTEPLGDLGVVDSVLLSGGVSEFVHNADLDFDGDLGASIGRALRESSPSWPTTMVAPLAGREATVIGASQYSFQVSGNTTFLSDPAILPLRNLTVLRPDLELAESIDVEAVAAAIRESLSHTDLDSHHVGLAIAMHWLGTPSHARIKAFAEGISRGVGVLSDGHRAVCIVVDGDIAQSLGFVLRDELHIESPLVVLDGIVLEPFDFIDIGAVLEPSKTVPITIKSLIFKM
jgi:ethanolamine utilization protein EutA